MSQPTFLDNFRVIARAPNGLRQIRSAIHSLAIQGRLSTPRETDTPVADFLESVSEHKNVAEEGSRRSVRNANAGQVPVGDHPVPASWRWVFFGDLVVNRDGERIPLSKAARISHDRKYDYYGASGVIDQVEDFIFDKPLLLIGEDGANLINRSTPIAFIATGKYWVNNHAHVLDGVSIDLLRYLELYINSITLEPYVTGTAQPKMNQAKMNSITVAVPPPEEQKRIVAKVEELMELCDRLESQLDERAKLLPAISRASHDRFVQEPTVENLRAIFHEVGSVDSTDLRRTIRSMAVTGRLTQPSGDDLPSESLVSQIRTLKSDAGQKVFPDVSESDAFFAVPEAWQWERMGNIASMNDSGWSPKCASTPRIGEDWGVLKVSAVTWDRFQPEENKALPSSLKPRPEHEVKDGDLLMSRANTFDLVAKSVVVESPPPHLMMSDKIVRFRFHDGINPYYVNLFNLSPWARDYYASNASGTSSSMKNIGRKVMCLLPVPIPSPQEQERIVDRVTELLKLCDLLESQRNEAEKLAEAFARTAVEILSATDIGEEPMQAPDVRVHAALQANTDVESHPKQLLTQILRQRDDATLQTKDVWQMSELDIAEFYRQLKFEIAQGWIIEPDVATVEVVETT